MPTAGLAWLRMGALVAVDIDVCADRFRSLGFTIKDAEGAALALVSAITALAADALGPTDFTRVGLPPKMMLFYGAADAIPTMAGGPIEIFCTPGSKQVVIYGFHPEAVDEYCWVGPHQPLTHRVDALHPVTAKQVVEFRSRALELCESAGLHPQHRIPSANGNGARVSSNVVGDYQSEVLSLIGRNRRRDPREIAAEYFRQSVDGEKHYRLVAICGALILHHFTDEQIIAALAPVYGAIVHDDPSLSRLKVCPRRVRAGMRARGTNVVTLTELDEWLGPNWSIRHA